MRCFGFVLLLACQTTLFAGVWRRRRVWHDQWLMSSMTNVFVHRSYVATLVLSPLRVRPAPIEVYHQDRQRPRVHMHKQRVYSIL
eukprot:m.171194 g.171194  ORF g.171194 m.171194 type:complete len:85 (+) comp13345_c0_seq1:119-373(+)